MYIPLSLPVHPAQPLQLDQRVLWHTSALLDTVLESATLPTRLRADGRRVPTLFDWEDSLGDAGRRKIAEVSLELEPEPGKHPKRGASADTRMRGVDQSDDEEGEDREATDKQLPVSFFREALAGQSGRRLGSRKQRTFARVDTYRGSSWQASDSDRDLRFLRRGRSIIETFSTRDPALPLLPTFPHIFPQARGPSQSDVPGLAVHTSLRTSSGIANWLRGMEAFVRDTPTVLFGDQVGGEEKEALRNTLGETAEAYVEGWESEGSSEDD